MPEQTILAIDTSAAACSVAIVAVGETKSVRQKLIGRGQAETLIPMIEEALAAASLSYSDLTKIAVIIGPGAYTGVRIGVSAARGLALALAIPCVGVTSLEMVAQQVRRGTVLAAVAGRGDTVFVQSFEQGVGTTTARDTARSVSLDEAKKLVEDVDHLVGSGRVQLGLDEEIQIEHMVDPAVLAQYSVNLDPAEHQPDPLYLREADAIAAKPVFDRVSE